MKTSSSFSIAPSNNNRKKEVALLPNPWCVKIEKESDCFDDASRFSIEVMLPRIDISLRCRMVFETKEDI